MQYSDLEEPNFILQISEETDHPQRWAGEWESSCGQKRAEWMDGIFSYFLEH